jgi:uncharacterized RDD family membrane protein YckC
VEDRVLALVLFAVVMLVITGRLNLIYGLFEVAYSHAKTRASRPSARTPAGGQFLYFAYSWAASGKTFGMAVFGIRVVRPDGTSASWRQAVVRTLALPLSFLLLGLGFLGIVLGDKRRALHDVIAGTAVVYSWDARAARLRFLSRG